MLKIDITVNVMPICNIIYDIEMCEVMSAVLIIVGNFPIYVNGKFPMDMT